MRIIWKETIYNIIPSFPISLHIKLITYKKLKEDYVYESLPGNNTFIMKIDLPDLWKYLYVLFYHID